MSSDDGSVKGAPPSSILPVGIQSASRGEEALPPEISSSVGVVLPSSRAARGEKALPLEISSAVGAVLLASDVERGAEVCLSHPCADESLSPSPRAAWGRVGEGGSSRVGPSPAERVHPPSEDLVNLDRDLPTTEEDVRRLRELKATVSWGPDRWAELQAWVDSMPNLEEALKRRKTFEGCEPFEL